MLKNTVTYLQIIGVLAIVAFVIIKPHIPQAHLKPTLVTAALDKAHEAYSGLDRAGRIVARTVRPLAPALQRSIATCGEAISQQASQILLAAPSRLVGPYRLLDLAH